MPGTVIDELDVIDAGRGGGISPPAGGDDDGRGSSGGARPVPQRAYFTGLQLGLVAIVMFFMALCSSYIVRKGLGTDWQSTPLPPIVWFNTVLLLASSVTIVVARRKLDVGQKAAFRSWWWITTGLGLVFLVGQLIAWSALRASGVFVSTNPSSSFFYLLTATHGVHLVGGVLALLYVARRTWSGSRISRGTAAELTSIYWHFMDGLWVFLLVLLTMGR